LAADLENRLAAHQDRRQVASNLAQLLLCQSGKLLVAVGSWLQKRSGAAAMT
jgi:hypothetical protein